LLLLSEAPADLASFKFPILYSLRQASISISDLEKYRELRKRFPGWASQLITRLFETYPDLRHLKEDLQSPYEDILLKLGLEPTILNDRTIPVELRASLESLLKKIIQNPEQSYKALAKELNFIDPVYIETVDIYVQQLKEKLKELGFDPPAGRAKDQVFEATENKTYYKIPTLFLYPYFLDENRVGDNDAGVIPYAWQTGIAVVINKSNKKYKEWHTIRDETRKNLDLQNEPDRHIDRAVRQEVSIKWLTTLIESLYKDEAAEINSVRGYVMYAFIQQFADLHITDNRKMVKILRRTADIDSFRVTSKLPFYAANIDAAENLNPNQILLLDPADAYNISRNGTRIFKNLNDEYDIVYVRHGLNIPVGIGFSLYALPYLLKNDVWRVLQEFMIEKLRFFETLFGEIGIKLMTKGSLTDENTPIKHEQRVKP
jgi:hypothetical protein